MSYSKEHDFTQEDEQLKAELETLRKIKTAPPLKIKVEQLLEEAHGMPYLEALYRQEYRAAQDLMNSKNPDEINSGNSLMRRAVATGTLLDAESWDVPLLARRHRLNRIEEIVVLKARELPKSSLSQEEQETAQNARDLVWLDYLFSE